MKFKFILKLILFFFAGLFVSCQKSSDIQTEFVNIKSFYYDWLSRKALELKQNQAAHDLILKALENQDSTDLHSNLGITFDLIEKKSDAEKSFLAALSMSKTEAEKFKYHFNLGVLQGAQKKIPEALEQYQAALDILPTSIESKHNIELLIQQEQQDQKNKKEGEDKDKDNKDKDPKDKGESKKDEPKENEGKDKGSSKDKDKDKDQGKDRKSNAKYKPRPFKGEQLSEGDVKKILGELSQQDQKIRSNFNKKDQRKEDKNEKDW